MACSCSRKIIPILVPATILMSCSGPAAVRSVGAGEIDAATIRSLALAADSVFTDSLFVGGLWSAQIVDLSTGRTLFRRNEQVNLLPASNAKMYTTAAALDQLGPDYRYETRLATNGSIRGDTLHGDLIVRGAGDPSFSFRFLEEDPFQPLEGWADSLVAAGVSVVDGDVIGDDDLFDDQVLGLGWQWDDEPYYYSAQVSALSLNGNCVEFTVTATQPGQPAVVSWAPDSTTYIAVSNHSVTIPGDQRGLERYYRARASNHIEVSSHVPEGAQQSECLTVENPTLYFVHVLREKLARRGITVTGHPIDIDDLVEPPVVSDQDRILARHVSPALSEIVAAVNKPSDNLFAELLLRTIGVERPVADSTVTPGSAWMGAEAAARTFAAASIDTSRIRLADGSGLSRMHLITTDMTSRLLTYMWNHPDPAVRDAFVSSLPVGGVDGTLENRYADGPARGNVQAKTGTMTSVSSLGGYVRTASGRPIAFALMCNNYTSPTSAVRAAQDRIVNLLASLP